MVTKAYKLYTATAANAAASLIIQRRGVITAIKWAAQLDNSGDNTGLNAELSFTPTGQVTTNDTIGPIDQVKGIQNVGAAGVSWTAVNTVTNGLAIPVNAGDRLYLNTGACSATADITCFVYVAE